MLLLITIKNFSFILYIFSFLINFIFKDLKFNFEKIIYFLIYILWNILFPSTAYCDMGWEEVNNYEKILNSALQAEEIPIKSDLNLEDVNSDLSSDNTESNLKESNKKIYYMIGVSVFLILSIGLYYYFSGGGENLPIPSSNMLNLNPFEESEVKYTEDGLNRKLDFDTTPQNTPEKALDRYASDISPEYEKGIRVLTDL